MPRALISGITGQDGGYLTQHLLDLGYEVVGLGRNDDLRAAFSARRPSITVLEADLRDPASLSRALRDAEPDEVYNLAAFSEPGRSWNEPELCCDITGLGALRLLEAARVLDRSVRFVQASSSEIFGRATEPRQDERTPLRPVTPYGCAKTFAHDLVRTYREAHAMFACNAILYNHESPHRGLGFVTRKITRGVAAISLGHTREIRLGNLEVARDWGHAADYVRAMALMARSEQPSDYVVATGELHTLRQFLEQAFAAVGIDDWTPYVIQDPSLFRPIEAAPLTGDATQAETKLGWKPRISFAEMVADMVAHDIAELSADEVH